MRSSRIRRLATTDSIPQEQPDGEVLSIAPLLPQFLA